MGRDDPHIPRDIPKFMLAPHSMTDVEYNMWGSGISYAEKLLEGLDCEEFNLTRLMPSLIIQVCIQTLALRFFLLSLGLS